MKLINGAPGWPKLTPSTWTYPTLQEDVECDVLVIGAGMSGGLISHELAKKGLRTVTVEKRSVGAGSTCANTGLLQFSNDKPLSACINSFGLGQGVRFYKLCEQAVKKLLAIHDSLLTKADMFPRSSLYFASEEADVPGLKEEYQALKQHGFSVEWWEEKHIEASFGFRKPAGIITHGDAEVNPAAFVQSLFETATKKYGLQLFEHTRVVRREDHADHITIFTDNGSKITTKHIVYATGYETQEYKKDENAVLESSFAIITEPVEDIDKVWPDRYMIWETARPYKYFRMTTDNRIVAGGFDFGSNIWEERERMLAQAAKKLEAEIEKLFPALAPIHAEYPWAAAFCSTHDGLPMIGTHPNYNRSTFIQAYGGNGDVYCSIATDIIPALIEYGYHPDAELFRFDRPHTPSVS